MPFGSKNPTSILRPLGATVDRSLALRRTGRALILSLFCSAGVIVLLAGGAARGAIVTIGITGDVTKIEGTAGVLEGRIDIGDIFSGSYTYDSSAAGLNGSYQFNTMPFGISLNMGDLLFASDPQNVDFLIEVSNDSIDSYFVSSSNNLPVLSGVIVSAIHWQLEDDTGTAINSDALPLTAPFLSDWQSLNYLSITCRGFAGVRIEGTITEAYIIPEPATILMFGAGILIFCSGDKRRTPNTKR